MKQKNRRPRYRRLPDKYTERIAETVETAIRMAEQGLRPMPIEIEDVFEGTFTGDTWETSWHFADHLLLLTFGSTLHGTQARFDIIVDKHEFATTLIDIPIIAHLELQVTPIDTLPSDDVRYDDLPNDVPLWRIHSSDFEEYPDETYLMLLLDAEAQTDEGEQHDSEK